MLPTRKGVQILIALGDDSDRDYTNGHRCNWEYPNGHKTRHRHDAH